MTRKSFSHPTKDNQHDWNIETVLMTWLAITKSILPHSLWAIPSTKVGEGATPLLCHGLWRMYTANVSIGNAGIREGTGLWNGRKWDQMPNIQTSRQWRRCWSPWSSRKGASYWKPKKSRFGVSFSSHNSFLFKVLQSSKPFVKILQNHCEIPSAVPHSGSCFV